MKEESNSLYLKYSLYPIYQIIKEYYLFYFPEYAETHYYSAVETKRLYELILKKKENPLFEKWCRLLKKIKVNYPEFRVRDLESNKPSFTAMVQLPTLKKKERKAYFSISLLGPYYMIFIEDTVADETTLTISPQEEYKELFLYFEKLIESTFDSYIFLCYNLLMANFFSLVIPGRNQSRREDGYVDRRLSILQGLFFDYDLYQDGFFSTRGDGSYKTPNYLAKSVDLKEVAKIKHFLKDTTISWKEIE